jgi:phosphoribosyl 1,2-cyclic phosphate phosphodiesterase
MINLFYRVDVLVVDALRRQPHPTHAHLAWRWNWSKPAAPGSAVLTHLDKSMDYRALCSETPDHVQPGYDGLEIEL